MHLEAAQATAKKAQMAAARFEKQAREGEVALRRAKVAASERLKKIKAMRVEYNKLFRAVQESQKHPPPPYQTATEAHEEANRNPCVVVV